MDDITTKRFEAIANHLINNIEQVQVDLPECLEGAKLVASMLADRIEQLEDEVRHAPAKTGAEKQAAEKDAKIHGHPALRG